MLADEINRAPAKVQSALLEAMQERQVTIGDNTYALPEPFLVMATQNPIEQEGTYPLPGGAGGPVPSEGCHRLSRQGRGESHNPSEHPCRAGSGESGGGSREILEVQKIVQKIYIDEKIENYIVDIVFATRQPAKYGLNDLQGLISFGASPRASISLALAARAYAFLQGRGYVIPEDVRAVCHDVIRHRIGLTYEAEANNISADEVVTDILDKVAVP